MEGKNIIYCSKCKHSVQGFLQQSDKCAKCYIKEQDKNIEYYHSFEKQYQQLIKDKNDYIETLHCTIQTLDEYLRDERHSKKKSGTTNHSGNGVERRE